ncbi:MAG: AAA family ATPase [Bacteroidales bacterium]|nr:AAA family ATPase [Bacteroidales bacterium]
MKSLELYNYKGFKEKHPFDLNEKVTVFIGDNGFGKTSICEATAMNLDILAEKLFDKELELNINNSSELKNNSVGINDANIKAVFSLDFNFSVNQNFDFSDKDLKFYGIKKQSDEFYNVKLDIETGLSLTKKEKIIKVDDRYKSFYEVIKPIYNKTNKNKYPFIFYGNKIEKQEIFKDNNKEKSDFVYYKALSFDRYNFINIIDFIKTKVNTEDKEILKKYFLELIKNLEEVLNNNDERISYEIFISDGDKKYGKKQLEKKNELKIKEDFKIIILKKEYQENSKTNIVREDEISYKELSAGEKNLFTIISDLTTRLFFSQKETGQEFNTNTLNAIVIIDELDLHLHPKWQRMILPKLLELFPNVQFIITTHSPFVLQNIPLNINSKLIRLPNEEILEYRGREIDRMAIDIFSIKEIRPEEVKEKINYVYELIEKNELKEAEEYLEILKELLTQNDDDIVQLETLIELKKMFENDKD